MTASLLLVPLCFVAGVLWAPWLIERLRELRFGKQIRLEGQEHHLAKQGTPTMGGWLFVVTSAVAMALFVREPRVVVPVAGGMLLFALFGALDDYANIKNREGLGLHVHLQIVVQLVLSVVVGAALYGLYGVERLEVPWLGGFRLGGLMIPFAALVVFATSTAANIIDGLDGLAAGTVALALAAYLVIAYRRDDAALVGATAAFIGALLAFLWFNVHPARLFMGGTGSTALGAGLATVALLSGESLLLPVIAALLVVSLGSSILQTTYFKLTRGKRLFRRAPYHHHLELSGWPEVQIVFRFWLIAALCAVLGVVLAEA
ncbi:MAG TPA: phospho-N-acetylmuramoyl-pentapeptide-transferase [Chloroflexota bacterium]|nr:phospho-N-acetylmuramoyl-pentapeptide-transferase [Chloroflexota bacterium]